MSSTIKRAAFGRIRRFVRGDGVHIVFQPITDLDTGMVVGFESLARFDGLPARSPAAWFEEAAAVGLRRELELTTARAAVAAIDDLPEDTYLTVNASPDVAMDPAFIEAVPVASGRRIVIEITEHAPIEDYDAFNDALSKLRERGVRVAIDDAGAGFANMTHILRLEPDVIKLDIELTRHIDIDARRRALVRSLVAFAASVDATLVAEGIETEAELGALRALGVGAGQGYHLGRPKALPGHEDEAPIVAPRLRFLSAAALRVSDVRSFRHSRRAARRVGRPRPGLARPLIAAVVGTMILAPATLAYADVAAPGSPGYWVKRRVESVRLVVALDRATETRLHLDFARRRMNELSELLAEGRPDLASMLLADYRHHVDAVSGVLSTDDPASPGLKKRIENDLSDYVARLGNERPVLCAAGGNANSCGAADEALRGSQRILTNGKGNPAPKPPAVDPGGKKPAPPRATPPHGPAPKKDPNAKGAAPQNNRP